MPHTPAIKESLEEMQSALQNDVHSVPSSPSKTVFRSERFRRSSQLSGHALRIYLSSIYPE